MARSQQEVQSSAVEESGKRDAQQGEGENITSAVLPPFHFSILPFCHFSFLPCCHFGVKLFHPLMVVEPNVDCVASIL